MTVVSFASRQDAGAAADWPEGIALRRFATFGSARYGLAPGMAWHMLRLAGIEGVQPQMGALGKAGLRLREAV